MPRTPTSARLHDVAVLVPLAGLFLLMPPFITLFAVDVRPFGIPLLALYVFGVWIVLIVVAALMARRLAALEPPARAADRAAATPGAETPDGR